MIDLHHGVLRYSHIYKLILRSYSNTNDFSTCFNKFPLGFSFSMNSYNNKNDGEIEITPEEGHLGLFLSWKFYCAVQRGNIQFKTIITINIYFN